jgi:hypothetical protein
LIAALGSLIIPAHFVVEIATHHYEERLILKYSSYFILGSLFAILNYEGMVYDVLGYGDQVEEIITDTSGNPEEKGLESLLNHYHEFPYDWNVGELVYVFSLSAIFMGTIILEVRDDWVLKVFT